MSPDHPDQPEGDSLATDAVAWATEVAAFLDGEERPQAATAIRSEIERPPKGRPAVIVAGEDKRGKSSLVNALLRRPGVSPVGIEVVTGVPMTFFRASPDQAFVLHYQDAERHPVAWEEAQALATVQGNPGNEYNVRGVSLGLECPLLEKMLLVDTPGVGGLESGHATLTLQRLKGADALLFVLEAGAPIRSQELKFLRNAAARIDRVLFALTKTDLHRGWQQILDDNRAILRENAPRFAEAPMLPVSSMLAQRSAKSEGDLADELWRESGYHELERTLVQQVAGHLTELRAANIGRTGLGPLFDMERVSAGRVQALAGPHQAQEEIAAHRAVLVELNRERFEWQQNMQVEFRKLVLDRGEQFARAVLELRNRYDERLKDVKMSEHDTLPGEFVADLAAIAAQVNDWTQQRIVDLVVRLVGDTVDNDLIASSLRKISDAAFAEELVGASLGDISLDSTEKISVVQSYSSGHSMASLLAVGGATLIAPPIALGLGILLGGSLAYTRFKNAKTSNFVQEFKSWMGDQVQRAQISVSNELQRAQIDLEVGIRDTLREAFAQREAELNAAIADCQKVMQQEQGARQADRQKESARLQQLREVKQRGLALLARAKG